MSTDAKQDLSAEGLLKSDKELLENAQKLKPLAKEFNTAASAETLSKTAKTLESKGFVVKVAKDAADALAYITAIPQEGQSICSGGSTTLDEIGFTEWAKGQSKFKDFKALSLEKINKGDFPGGMALRKQGGLADVFFAGAAAVSQDGEVLWGSGTGTRVSILAGKLIFVVGSNKIVADATKGRQRLTEWQLPLESARMRAAYKMPKSGITEMGSLHGVTPYAPGSIHVVILPGVYGY